MKYKLIAIVASMGFIFAAYAADTTPPATSKTAAEMNAFQAKYDKNKDGKISKDESKAAGITDAQFKKADTNNDGFIDGKEFKVSQTFCC